MTGRKRHIFVDTLGFLLAVAVARTALDDAAAAPQVLAQVTPDAAPRLTKIWGDSKYRNHGLNAWLAQGATGLFDWRLCLVLPTRKVSCCCPNVGWPSGRSAGSDAADGTAGRPCGHEKKKKKKFFFIHLMLRRLAPARNGSTFNYHAAA